MQDELDNMRKKEVWELVKSSPETKPLGCRWVFKMKRGETGNIVRHKARLIAQGYNQVKGETYDEVFSPIVNFSRIQLFFSLFADGHIYNAM